MRVRLIASFILIVIVTIGIVVLVTMQQTAQEVRNFMFRGGMSGSTVVVAALEEYYKENHSWKGVKQVLEKTSQKTAAGSLGQRMNGRGNNQISPRPLLRLADANGKLLGATDGSKTEGSLTQVEMRRAVRLEVDGKVVGYLFSDGNQFFTSDNENTLLSRLNRSAIIAVLIAGIVSVFLALLLSYSLLRPVKALTQAASNLGAGDLSQRVYIQGKDELTTLGNTFNQMAESLQKVEESRRALTADIAHELRTPLAVQRAHLEAIEDGVYPLSLETLNPIEEQNHLLTRLVEDLRTIALADAGQLALETTPTDLTALIKRVAARFEPQAADRQIEINLHLEAASPMMSLDPQRIEQILQNLMDNALRYSPDGSVIAIQLSVTDKPSGLELASDPSTLPKADNRILVTVRDSGPGIPENALPRIFDRFYRAEKSRSRAEGGTGLGLSIARKIAQAHGGELTAANHPNGGAVFTLELPLKVEN